MMLWLAACTTGPRPGTAVGNPGDADLFARAVDPAIVLTHVAVPIAGVAVERCSGRDVALAADTVLDGLAPSNEPAMVPGGRACAIALDLDGDVEVEGETAYDVQFVVRLPVDDLVADGEVWIDGQALLFELPLPLDAWELQALGPDVDLPADDPLAIEWGAAATAAAQLYEDVDGDGAISDVDAVLMDPVGAMDASSSSGCGCRASPGGSAAGWLGALLLGMARRRKRASAAVGCRRVD
jgi:MYXO-CTERM domain-containing protein